MKKNIRNIELNRKNIIKIIYASYAVAAGKNLNKVKTLPYKDNYGYFFSSGPNTWHGMEKKEILKERRCLQVNYVTFETDWKVY